MGQAQRRQEDNVVELEALTPPNSTEAEQAVLGAVLFAPDSLHRIVEILKPADFYRGAHRLIFEAMLDLYEQGEPVEVVTVGERLTDEGNINDAGGRSYLMDLAMSVATAENIVYYADIVKAKATLRNIIEAGNEMAYHAAHEASDPQEALDVAQRLVFQIAQEGIKDEVADLAKILPVSFEQIEERVRNKGTLMGVSTGFYDLDTCTSGLQKSDLIIVAARPSMGKTAFCLNIASNVALQENKPVLIFSLEMSKEQLVLRMLCGEAEIDAQRVRTGDLYEGDFQKITAAMGRLGDRRVYIDDTPQMTIMEMRAKARKVQLEAGEIGLVVVDYLQLIEGRKGGYSDNRTNEISAISRGLKGLARELKAPVVALSQLSRAVESRQDKKPMLSDLRESGSIEQDADVVMFIYRDEYYNKESERPGTADIIIAKQRNGPVGEVSLLFRHNTTRFMNPADARVKVF